MHASAQINAEKFYKTYCTSLNCDSRILDVGSFDGNGSLKPIFKDHVYIGIDQIEGQNVNVVCKNDNMPFKDGYFDVAVSSSCFEHDIFFWLTFLEMCRVVKDNGYIYINAPSNGPYHPHFQDCWRFYADSWKSLEQWGIRNNYNVVLLHSYIDVENKHLDPNLWEDSVGIFQKKSK